MAERALQASIIDYLSALRPTVSDPDGLDVALDVLGEIFSLKTEGDRRHAGSTNLLDAFSKSYVATSAPTAESKDPIEGASVGTIRRQRGHRLPTKYGDNHQQLVATSSLMPHLLLSPFVPRGPQTPRSSARSCPPSPPRVSSGMRRPAATSTAPSTPRQSRSLRSATPRRRQRPPTLRPPPATRLERSAPRRRATLTSRRAGGSRRLRPTRTRSTALAQAPTATSTSTTAPRPRPAPGTTLVPRRTRSVRWTWSQAS